MQKLSVLVATALLCCSFASFAIAEESQNAFNAITEAVSAVCLNPGDAGKFWEVKATGSGQAKLLVLKKLVDAGIDAKLEFTSGEYEGVQRVLAEQQDKENANYRDCVRDLTPRFLDKLPDLPEKAGKLPRDLLKHLELGNSRAFMQQLLGPPTRVLGDVEFYERWGLVFELDFHSGDALRRVLVGLKSDPKNIDPIDLKANWIQDSSFTTEKLWLEARLEDIANPECKIDYSVGASRSTTIAVCPFGHQIAGASKYAKQNCVVGVGYSNGDHGLQELSNGAIMTNAHFTFESSQAAVQSTVWNYLKSKQFNFLSFACGDTLLGHPLDKQEWSNYRLSGMSVKIGFDTDGRKAAYDISSTLQKLGATVEMREWKFLKGNSISSKSDSAMDMVEIISRAKGVSVTGGLWQGPEDVDVELQIGDGPTN